MYIKVKYEEEKYDFQIMKLWNVLLQKANHLKLQKIYSLQYFLIN